MNSKQKKKRSVTENMNLCHMRHNFIFHHRFSVTPYFGKKITKIDKISKPKCKSIIV